MMPTAARGCLLLGGDPVGWGRPQPGATARYCSENGPEELGLLAREGRFLEAAPPLSLVVGGQTLAEQGTRAAL